MNNKKVIQGQESKGCLLFFGHLSMKDFLPIIKLGTVKNCATSIINVRIEKNTFHSIVFTNKKDYAYKVTCITIKHCVDILQDKYNQETYHLMYRCDTF